MAFLDPSEILLVKQLNGFVKLNRFIRHPFRMIGACLFVKTIC